MDVEIKYENDGSIVSTHNAKNQVWLLKVPQFVYEHICEKPEGATLGKITMTRDMGSDKTEVTSCHLDNVGDIPSDYSISQLSLTQKQFIYSEDQDSGELSMEGQVNLKLGMVTDDKDPSYKNITYNRFKTANQKTRFIKAEIEKDPITRQLEDKSYKRPVVVKEVREKRERLPKENLLVLLFEAYKKKDSYSLQELNKIVNQPEGYLKEVLNEIATQQREEKVLVWTLKPGMLVRDDAMDVENP